MPTSLAGPFVLELSTGLADSLPDEQPKTPKSDHKVNQRIEDPQKGFGYRSMIVFVAKIFGRSLKCVTGRPWAFKIAPLRQVCGAGGRVSVLATCHQTCREARDNY